VARCFCGSRKKQTSSWKVFAQASWRGIGLGYDALAAVNPRPVYCSITGYGQDGPYADRAGHDITTSATQGWAIRIGTEEAPVVPNFQIADLLGGALTSVMEFSPR